MSASESVLFSNISATTAAFALKGGRYALNAHATWGGGSVNMSVLGPDGSTYLTPLNISGIANTLTADGQQVMDLPPGQYKVTIATASAVYASVSSVPT